MQKPSFEQRAEQGRDEREAEHARDDREGGPARRGIWSVVARISRGRHDGRRALVVGLAAYALSLLGTTKTAREAETRPPKLKERVQAALSARNVLDLPRHWDLPETRNERVDFFLDFLRGNNYEHTRLWLERLGMYGPMILESLEERDMPRDLVYLAMIESGFSPTAYSHAHAVGIWQFIEETGQRYGLEVSEYVDERRDPVKSTGAALDYLQDLHDRFGSWYLAAASYNTGENRVHRILRERAGGELGNDELYWAISEYIPRETRDYVPLMLAAGYIGKDPEAHGFIGLIRQEPLRYDEVTIPPGTPLELVARAARVSAEQVEELNPHLIKKMTPPEREWDVRLPPGQTRGFAANLDRLIAG